MCVVHKFTHYQIVKCFEDLNSNAGWRNGNGKEHSCMSSSMSCDREGRNKCE